ncbi:MULTISPECIES: winged helix-turn-helix domain-containing protein [Sphingobium]|jgi:two-component system OmpR family response regulator|uniref:DNA-binding response regulator n=2 Tax=Sphingobium TaxID=165695 RepID=A0A084E8U7_SPHYA|nr:MULTISPECIES: response regulator transcription factor [Sphingobium]AYO78750.1 DNA-binding response regulator [Sphingobium yanoikuyae]KEZ14389.1 Two-component response regulator [Sphingobium yanoikuyae]KFD27663.1 transcriptional regulator [Sphingobium yanoikuyae]KZC75392.1 two-component system response regulator [Sphingobium yanoikuyae]MDG2513903.1 response regulator transcription factor [Sphingobium yanoikuyae]
MKLLLLEDDETTRVHLERVLTAAGHVLDVCDNGRDAIFLGSSGDHAVLILDRMVPGLDGLAVLKALRAAGVRAPALFLTAMNGVEDRVEGLEAGADDYLAKPFAATELLARVNALARRPPIAETVSVLEVSDLSLDRIKRTVLRGGNRIELQAQEFKLLEYLMLHAGEIVTRTMLLENVWSFHFDPRTNIIESHVSRLRAKVDRGFGRELIQTVRGAGYRIDDV